MKAEFISNMGDDLTVVNAARVSFEKESGWSTEGTFGTLKEGDKKLIKYLAKHGHWTPFSHPQITLRETVPIFLSRQRFKHMVGFTYNEVSRRYVDTPPEFYVPDTWRSKPEGSIKQGSGEESVKVVEWDYDYVEDVPVMVDTSEVYEEVINTCNLAYSNMLKAGVAPEQARMVLPQSMYTSYYVTGSLAAWARFYKQRVECSAQKEIQDLAKMCGELIEPLYPESWAALTGEN